MPILDQKNYACYGEKIYIYTTTHKYVNIKLQKIPSSDIVRICLESPGQKYIQHHEEKYPSHIGHLGQTITDHTWVLHEEPLEHDQNSVCYQEFQWKGTIHHASKIFLTRPEMKRQRLGSISH